MINGHVGRGRQICFCLGGLRRVFRPREGARLQYVTPGREMPQALCACMLLSLACSGLATAQQPLPWIITNGSETNGTLVRWQGLAPTYEMGALATLALDHVCYSNGKGGCLSIALQSCNPSGAPIPQTSSMCRIISPGESSFWFYIDVWGKQEANAYWVQAPPPPAAVTCPTCVGDPINPAVGNVYRREQDVAFAGGPGSIAFRRFYSSADSTGSDIGPAWRHSYDQFITVNYQPTVAATYPGASATVSGTYTDPSTACITGFSTIRSQINGWQSATANYDNSTCVITTSAGVVGTMPVYSAAISSAANSPVEYDAVRDDGEILRYTTQSGAIDNPPGTSLRLAQTSTGFTLTDTDDTVEIYNSNGVLQSITSRNGVVKTLSYDSQGRLSGVTDSFGHSLTIARNTSGQISSVTAGGQTVQYAYDTASRLSQVTNSDSTTEAYFYENTTGHLYALTGVQDESGNRLSSWGYDTQGRAVSSTEAGGADSAGLVYNSDGSVTVTDALATARTYTFGRYGDLNLVTGISGPPCATCGDSKATTYDSAGYSSSRTDYNGNVTLYTYDDTRGLEISRTEASGSSVVRTITTQWNSTFRLPTIISVYAGSSASGTPVRTTSYVYDDTGNLLTRVITDPANGSIRTWTYTYDSYGRVLTADGPRTDVPDVTTYTYYTCTTGYQCGELDTVTDGLGHVTTYNSYDANGRPLSITDPNGAVTTLTYDLRGRLTSRTVAGETTSFSYYPTGLLQQVTLPDGSSLSYTYDPAHRLTQVSDGLGNKVVYTLDAMGNRTAENTYDPSGALHRTHTRVINALNEVYQEVNAAGTSAVTTTFGYDNEGNPTAIDAPLSRNTGESYDALNRVSSITDPTNGVTAFGYDAQDDLTSVKDPRNLTTSYGYDGFGDLTSQSSPDTGSTTNTYDSAGNLATSTDARGAVATYGYDALNRVTSIAYSLNGTADQTLAFTYDQGTDGIGHLTGASDANHSMSFSYDALGEMTGMSQTVGGVVRSITYAHTNGDLTSITTPSGQTVTYGYNANHQVTSIAVNGTTVLSNVSYEPFGPVNGWTWGNGSAFSRTFNGDGLISGISSPGSQEGLSYDDGSRISGITNTASGASHWTYGYDQLDRLTSAESSSLTQGWTYDADGNRLSETGSSPSTYSIAATSNQITGITGALTRSYGYDAAGDTLSDSTDTDTYNDAGRLKTLTNTSGSTTFIYNALGQMIKASGSSGTVLYVYDQAGHLLGEYDGAGNLIQETVWLGDIPVATLRPNGSSIAIYYVVTDQLGTPREVVRPSDNAVMWTWFTGPFGTEAPNTNPQGAGLFTYDLRLPGQIAGTWGSTFQNFHRDYDPAVGRYIESDPIGLAGGSYSTYSYAGSDPLSNSDPSGLAPPGGNASPGISVPYPFFPPVAVPGTAENQAWYQNAQSQIPDDVQNATDVLRTICDSDCWKIEADITALAAELRWRYYSALFDPKQLYERARQIPLSRRSGSWLGHRQQFIEKQKVLRDAIAEADAKGCLVTPEDRALSMAPYPDTPAGWFDR
jgi:RHS repeat-associated protein